MDHPDGLLLETRESEEFLVLNGTQTQSARVYNLLDAMDDMRALGVDVVRLSPQSSDMQEVITLFNQARHRLLPPAEAMARLAPLMPGEGCNGYWHGKPGLEQCAAQEPATA
jgi:collagenase-like PrtC family protease